MTFHIDYACLSDPGRKRRNNEDSALTDPSLGLALVADGMGGYKAGEIASALAARCMVAGLRALPPKLHRGSSRKGTHASAQATVLLELLSSTNTRIRDTAARVPQCHGMGTTLVAAWFHGKTVTLAHVGDSRVYRFRDGLVEQLTADHSLRQELVDKGVYTEEEAAENTPKNLVTRALGIDALVDAEISELDLQAEDLFVLCSDGLSDVLSPGEIGLTLRNAGANLQQAARDLVRLANQAGGPDNISVALARAQPGESDAAGWLSKLKARLAR